jgi:hypothetical protein
MPTIWTLLRAAVIAAGSSAALVVGGPLGSANADPVPPAPAPNIGEQLLNSATGAPQMLRDFANAFASAPATAPKPSPLASAATPIQQPPAAIPGAVPAVPGQAPSPLVPGTTSFVPGTTSFVPGATAPAGTPATPLPATAIPGMTPSAPAPALAPAQLLPSASISLPQLPFFPLPLPQQISLPGDLASLGAGGVTPPRSYQPGTTAGGVAVPRGPQLGTAPAPTAPALASSPLQFALSALP